MVHDDVSRAFRFGLPETTITRYICFTCLVAVNLVCASVGAVERGSLGAFGLIPENYNAVYLIANKEGTSLLQAVRRLYSFFVWFVHPSGIVSAPITSFCIVEG